MSRKPWFEVDRKGLAQIIERRGKAFVIAEVLQNAWDEPITRVDLTLKPIPGKPQAELQVIDDSPDGFRDLRDAFTLFAPSYKKGDPEKRGRFNLGEKLLLSISVFANITSTTGTVTFGDNGRTETTRTKRPAGTSLLAHLKMTRAEVEEALEFAKRLIPPDGVTTTINGEELPHRTYVSAGEATLPTEISDEDGVLRRTRRKSQVLVFEPMEGESPTIYEMGIPVVEHDGRWHVDVCVAPETKILTRDLRYISAGSVVEGDELLGFDENRVGHRRRFRSSSVVRSRIVKRPCYRLVFDDGTEVICSSDHQWVTAWSKTKRWLSTGRLRPTRGRKPGSRVVRLLDVWDTGVHRSDGYLAGAFDSDGWLLQRETTNPIGGVANRVGFSQNEGLVLDHVGGLLAVRGFKFQTRRLEPSEGGARNRTAPHTQLFLSDRQEILRFLGQIRPHRLLDQFNPDLLGSLPTQRCVRLVEKEFSGRREVVSIETTTHTYIAEGLASHNCQKVPLNLERDNVTPGYLRKIRTFLLNEMSEHLTREDTTQPWVRDALPQASDSAVRKTLTKMVGKKAVVVDPSNPEANKRALEQGRTLVHGGTFSKEIWTAARRAFKDSKTLAPAGQVIETGVPSSPDGVPPIPEATWTPRMEVLRVYAQRFGEHVIGKTVTVQFYKVSRFRQGCGAFGAWYGRSFVMPTLSFNIGVLGKWWVEKPDQEAVDRLLIHEFAHDKVSDHLSDEFHRECCRIGAKLRTLRWDLNGEIEFQRGLG
jgi:hypothetical protein